MRTNDGEKATMEVQCDDISTINHAGVPPANAIDDQQSASLGNEPGGKIVNASGLMTSAQFQLIESLTPVIVMPRRSRNRRKPLALTSYGHRSAIQCLLQGPTLLAQVARVAGFSDEEQVIAELRDLGLDVPTLDVPAPGPDDQVIYVVVCQLTTADISKVLRYIKEQAEKSEEPSPPISNSA